TKIRPLNVAVAKGSHAERFFRERAGLPGGEEAHPEVIAPGLHPSPRHDLRHFGGKVIKDLTFTNFYLGGAQAWQQSDILNIDRALAAAMSDKNLNNVMVQYFGNQPITSTFKPSRILPGPKPSIFSQGDVENLVAQLHTQGHLSGFDLTSTVFNFLLPSGTVLNTNTAPTGAIVERTGETSALENPAQP